MTKVFFITGAEGTGKSSLIPFLEEEFPNCSIHDFDENEVPDNPPLQWRLDTTLYWIKEAIKNQKNERSTIVSGLIFPDELESYKEHKKIGDILFCFLDVHENERERRLRKRNTPEMIDDLEQLHELRRQFKRTKFNKQIIDTTDKKLEEVARLVVKWIKDNLI